MHVRVVTERSVELFLAEKKQTRVIRWKSIALDLDQHRISVDNDLVSASRAEIGLLHLLISRRNLPMTRDFIMSALFGPEHGRDSRQVDMFVARLRRSLAVFGLGGLVQTVSGRGYAILDDDRDPVTAVALPHGWEPATLAF